MMWLAKPASTLRLKNGKSRITCCMTLAPTCDSPQQRHTHPAQHGTHQPRVLLFHAVMYTATGHNKQRAAPSIAHWVPSQVQINSGFKCSTSKLTCLLRTWFEVAPCHTGIQKNEAFSGSAARNGDTSMASMNTLVCKHRASHECICGPLKDACTMPG
jgi:hypothetical protein